MRFGFELILLGSTMFVGMLLAIEGGRRLGLRRIAREGSEAWRGSGVVESATFGLFGLLMAFAFNGAASRYDARRMLTVNEANAIGTAWLRLDILAPEPRNFIKERFREYLDERLKVPENANDPKRAAVHLDRMDELRREIWQRATDVASNDPRPGVGMLILPAFNQVFDLASTQYASHYIHIPSLIMYLLFGLALASGVLAGHAMAGRSHHWLHILIYSLLISITFMVTLDLEFPRLGLIRLDAADQPLKDVRAQIN